MKKTDADLLAFTDAELDKLLKHRRIKVATKHKDAIRETKEAALELIYQHKEILDYFIYVRESLRDGIIELSHPHYRGTKATDVLVLHAKVDFINKVLDNAEALWKTRDKRRQ